MSDATYRLCPRCLRAVPSESEEHYCPNDGTKMISGCPSCHAPIRSPYARYCTKCGLEFGLVVRSHRRPPRAMWSSLK